MSSAKSPRSASRLKISGCSKLTENSNPNLSNGSPLQKSGNSPAAKSVKSKKFSSKIQSQIVSPNKKFRDRKFVVAKKNAKRGVPRITCKCQAKVRADNQKCLCVAYENLRASQEEFFQNRSSAENYHDSEEMKNCSTAECGKQEKNLMAENLETVNGSEGIITESNGSLMNCSGNTDPEEFEIISEMGSFNTKRRRDKLFETARIVVPEPGSGRVMNLVKAFERLLTSKDSKDSEESHSEENQKGMKLELPGLQPKASETKASSSSSNQSDTFFASENFSVDSRVSSSLDGSQGSFSFTSRSSSGGRRSKRNSTESSGTFGARKQKKLKKKKQHQNVTDQQPFKLRTEQRGKNKEEEFIKKLQEMITEEEKQRIPIAQGLPWTTDEPECLVKPLVKETTKPVDLKLHSDLRAVDRAEFDHHVVEKLNLIEQYKVERERQQKLAEEEEIKRLRRELVPKAQPMPFFDRPFLPRRSVKHPTIPKEPNFKIPQQKKIKCME